MRRNVLLTIAALVLVTGFASWLPAQGPQPAAPTEWEYRLLAFDGLTNLEQTQEQRVAAIESGCNKLGKEGWDIATSLPGGSSSSGRSGDSGWGLAEE